MTQRTRDPRIDAMFQGDKLWAYGLLILLWLSVLFVFLMVLPFADAGLTWAMAIGGGLVLIFKSASILAMTKHYSEDRDNIYGLDIHYLDEMRK